MSRMVGKLPKNPVRTNLLVFIFLCLGGSGRGLWAEENLKQWKYPQDDQEFIDWPFNGENRANGAGLFIPFPPWAALCDILLNGYVYYMYIQITCFQQNSKKSHFYTSENRLTGTDDLFNFQFTIYSIFDDLHYTVCSTCVVARLVLHMYLPWYYRDTATKFQLRLPQSLFSYSRSFAHLSVLLVFTLRDLMLPVLLINCRPVDNPGIV